MAYFLVNSMACTVSLPFSTEPLKCLLNILSVRLGHNFYSALLVIGSAALVLHYKEMINKLRYCPNFPPIYSPIRKTMQLPALLCNCTTSMYCERVMESCGVLKGIIKHLDA